MNSIFCHVLLVTVVGSKSLLNEPEWQDEVPDPHLKIRGGGRSSRPLDKGGGGGGRIQKFIFGLV